MRFEGPDLLIVPSTKEVMNRKGKGASGKQVVKQLY